MILLHSSKFCLHMPSTTGSTSTLVYMYDDESLPVRLGHIHIYSPNLTTDDDRQEIEKKSPSPNTSDKSTRLFYMTMSMTDDDDDECKCRIGLKPIESA